MRDSDQGMARSGCSASEETILINDRPLVSVVIVNYNGLHFLPGCLASLQAYLPPASEVIVVDNASTDGSPEWLETHHSEVRLIRSPRNLGFAGGNNLGAQSACGEYLLLLNNDTEVQTALRPMLDLMAQNPSIGALGCQLVYGDGHLQESAGYAHTWYRLILSWLPLKRLFPTCAAFRRTVPAASDLYGKHLASAEWVSGACVLTPLALWRQVGGLDERYFMYVEDVDYCRRVVEAGHRVAYSACTTVKHYEGAGRRWVGRRAVLNTAASYTVFARKFFSYEERVALRILLPIIFGCRALTCLASALLRLDRDGHEKAGAFGAAAWSLLSGSVGRA